MAKAKKIHVTVGDRTPHWLHGETVIGKTTVAWKLGTTNYFRDYDEGVEDVTFSHRFIADQPKAKLKDYSSLRDSAILAQELQLRIESFVGYPSTNRPSLTPTTTELVAKAKTAGWTIMLNRAAIAQSAAGEAASDISMEEVLGKRAGKQ